MLINEDALIPCGAALPAAKAQMLLANKGIALFLYNYLPSGGFSPAALTSAAAAQTGLGAQMGTALPLSFAASRGAVSLLDSAVRAGMRKIEENILFPLAVRQCIKLGAVSPLMVKEVAIISKGGACVGVAMLSRGTTMVGSAGTSHMTSSDASLGGHGPICCR